MTDLELHPGSGHLRLSRQTFERLVAWYTDPRGPDRGALMVAELEAVGAVAGPGELAEPVAVACAAIADPVCRLTVRLRDDQGRGEQADGWVGADAAALLLPLPAERYELGVVHPTFLPAMLVRVVGLGPRPRLTGAAPVPASPELVDQLTDPDPARRAAATAGLAGPAGSMEVRRDWSAQASWSPAAESSGVRAVRVLDTAAGMWLVEAHQDRVMLFPTTPTAVWRALVGLLPTDPELGAGES